MLQLKLNEPVDNGTDVNEQPIIELVENGEVIATTTMNEFSANKSFEKNGFNSILFSKIDIEENFQTVERFYYECTDAITDWCYGMDNIGFYYVF